MATGDDDGVSLVSLVGDDEVVDGSDDDGLALDDEGDGLELDVALLDGGGVVLEGASDVDVGVSVVVEGADDVVLEGADVVGVVSAGGGATLVAEGWSVVGGTGTTVVDGVSVSEGATVTVTGGKAVCFGASWNAREGAGESFGMSTNGSSMGPSGKGPPFTAMASHARSTTECERKYGTASRVVSGGGSPAWATAANADAASTRKMSKRMRGGTMGNLAITVVRTPQKGCLTRLKRPSGFHGRRNL